jgi:hypothetical protein
MVGSNQRASSTLLRSRCIILFLHGLDLLGQHSLHGLIKDVLEAFLSQGTALHVFRLHLLCHSCCICLQNGSVLCVFTSLGIFLSLINLISHKNLRNVANDALEFGIPLNRTVITFLVALMKEEGSTTEKTMRKISAFG